MGRLAESWHLIEVSPLRERKEDIRDLLVHFLRKHERKFGKIGVVPSGDLVAELNWYDWPGNERQLEQAIQIGLSTKLKQGILFPGPWITSGGESDVAFWRTY